MQASRTITPKAALSLSLWMPKWEKGVKAQQADVPVRRPTGMSQNVPYRGPFGFTFCIPAL
jgi:hypothetical protein